VVANGTNSTNSTNGTRIAELGAAGQTLGSPRHDARAANVPCSGTHCVVDVSWVRWVGRIAQQTEMTNGSQRRLPQQNSTPLSLQCIARQSPSPFRPSRLPHPD
jgi:hypothetical protein